MAGRLQASRDSLFELSTLPVDQRIARILYRLAEKFGEQDDEFGLLIQMPLTRKDLADMAATTTETASRVISRLKKDGIIHAGRQWIAIEELQELETLSACFARFTSLCLSPPGITRLPKPYTAPRRTSWAFATLQAAGGGHDIGSAAFARPIPSNSTVPACPLPFSVPAPLLFTDPLFSANPRAL